MFRGTFCRNLTPEQNVMPYCETQETGENEDCYILRCDELWGKYVGNRGSIVQFGSKTKEYENLDKIWQDGLLDNENFVNLDGRFSMSKYMSHFVSDPWESFNSKIRTYFTAPFDGLFSFQISGENSHRNG